MVGLRVFDVGGLIAWLVWFHRLRDDDPELDELDGPDDHGEPRQPVVPPTPPLPDAEPWPQRRRDHTGDREPAAPARRRAPQRVREPA